MLGMKMTERMGMSQAATATTAGPAPNRVNIPASKQFLKNKCAVNRRFLNAEHLPVMSGRLTTAAAFSESCWTIFVINHVYCSSSHIYSYYVFNFCE